MKRKKRATQRKAHRRLVKRPTRVQKRATTRRPKAPKVVFAFGGGRADGNARMKDLLGGKGANLAEMAALGMPVPPGFTISTEVCTYFYANRRRYPRGLLDAVAHHLRRVEEHVGRRFGDPSNPLLVSVRS